jgi:hypothetical protein
VLHQWLERAGGCAASADLDSALRIAVHRVFDLDDVGAPIGQHGTGRRNEGELRDLHHLHTAHRMQHHWQVLSVQSGVQAHIEFASPVASSH